MLVDNLPTTTWLSATNTLKHQARPRTRTRTNQEASNNTQVRGIDPAWWAVKHQIGKQHFSFTPASTGCRTPQHQQNVSQQICSTLSTKQKHHVNRNNSRNSSTRAKGAISSSSFKQEQCQVHVNQSNISIMSTTATLASCQQQQHQQPIASTAPKKAAGQKRKQKEGSCQLMLIEKTTIDWIQNSVQQSSRRGRCACRALSSNPVQDQRDGPGWTFHRASEQFCHKFNHKSSSSKDKTSSNPTLLPAAHHSLMPHTNNIIPVTSVLHLAMDKSHPSNIDWWLAAHLQDRVLLDILPQQPLLLLASTCQQYVGNFNSRKRIK